MHDYTTLKENLTRRGFAFSAFDTGAEAVRYLNEALDGKTIGIGGSMTVKEIGLADALGTHNQVAWHLAGGKISEANSAEVYIASLNALAETGELVNIDGSGNRVSASAFGPRALYFVVGKNKLAPDLGQALWRARNVAAPKNAARLQVNTPCVREEPMRCHDCNSPDRICRELLIHWYKPKGIPHVEVVLIDEDLGY